MTGLLQPSEEAPAEGTPLGVGRGRLSYVATVTLIDVLPDDPGSLYDGYLALRTETTNSGLVPAAQRPIPVTATVAHRDNGTYSVARWRNFAYGLQWWFFAAAAIVFWWMVLRRAVREHRETLTPASTPPAEAASPLPAQRRRT